MGVSKLLFVSSSDLASPQGGRALLSRLLADCLAELLGDEFQVAEVSRGDRTSRLQSLRGFLDGLLPDRIEGLLERIRSDCIDCVFIDGSNLGKLAAAVKRRLPAVRVLVFCHNVEARFFLGALQRDRSLHAGGVLLANYRAERLAARYSDRLIALNARDSAEFKQLYGREATDILPMAMRDQLPSSATANQLVGADAYALFVGGAFYANQQGISWYVRHVAPHVDLPTVVIGNDMEAMRQELERTPRVRVVGGVERLDEWYRNARVAIAPIFEGSGMKTKVAEALMFGTPIVGTSEAFVGYEAVVGIAGCVCDTPEAFIAAIKEAEIRPIKALDPHLRALYEHEYSREAARERLRQILDS